VQPELLPHLRAHRLDARPFVNPRGGGSARYIPERNPEDHALRLLENLQRVQERLQQADADVGRAPRAEGHLVTAEAAEGTELAATSLGDKLREAVVVAETADRALIHFRRDDFSALMGKIEQYGNPDVLTRKGQPRNAPLVAPLQGFRIPTLGDLSDGALSEAQLDPGVSYWVELWVRGGRLESDDQRARVREEVLWLADRVEMPRERVRSFKATERDIYLLRLPGAAILNLAVLLPEVYRVIPASRGVRDLIVSELAPELIEPGNTTQPAQDASTVVILDTGIAEAHPLLEPAIVAPGISVVVGDPSANDVHGHGTDMAGLAAYRDLGGSLANGDVVEPRAWLENIRMLVRNQENDDDREFWSERTEAAVAAAESNGERRRVFNLSIGADNPDPGARTSWSVGIDLLAYNEGRGRLFCVAGGNVDPSAVRADYPVLNLASFINDPAQSINALTVGAMTTRDVLPDTPEYGTLEPLAVAGELSPFSCSGVGGSAPIKPEIVLEGGNCAPDGDLPMVGIETLCSLTTSHRHATENPLRFTWATSAACASASGLVAEVWEANPQLRPETVRALVVHSARWTPSLANQFPDRGDLIRAVGYGLPDPERAAYSLRGRPTVILEDSLRPAVREEGRTYRESHLMQLPLPDQVLLDLADHEVELAVTLSYFIEPNEANRARYAGATLKWDIQRSSETEAEFRQRINKVDRQEGFAVSAPSYPWDVGPDTRSRGSVQSDRCRITAAGLAGNKLIAVYPSPGWWDGRTERLDAAIPYGLVVSIDTGEADIDLYSFVEARIGIPIVLDV